MKKQTAGGQAFPRRSPRALCQPKDLLVRGLWHPLSLGVPCRMKKGGGPEHVPYERNMTVNPAQTLEHSGPKAFFKSSFSGKKQALANPWETPPPPASEDPGSAESSERAVCRVSGCLWPACHMDSPPPASLLLRWSCLSVWASDSRPATVSAPALPPYPL